MKIYHYCIEGQPVRPLHYRPDNYQRIKISGILNRSFVIDLHDYERIISSLANEHGLEIGSVVVLSLTLLGSKL